MTNGCILPRVSLTFASLWSRCEPHETIEADTEVTKASRTLRMSSFLSELKKRLRFTKGQWLDSSNAGTISYDAYFLNKILFFYENIY
jgi:hypothetical protein